MWEVLVNKIKPVLESLADTGDGLPQASVSVGIEHGTDAADPENLFNLADKAMYLAKRNGKRGYAFYKK